MSHRTVRPIVSLVGVSTTTSVPYAAKGAEWDIAIGGIPFALDPTPNKPKSRTTAKWYKNQWDISNQPGEQSLNYWWLRSQSSFHGGSGQVYLDGTDATISADVSALRYWDSIGVDVTVPGTVTLLNDTNALPILNTGAQMACDSDGTTPVVFVSNGNVLYRVAGDGTSVLQVSWGGAGTILSLTTDGSNYYAADQTGIYKGALSGSTGTLIYNTGSPKVVIAWIKQRLMAAIGTSVYELDAGAGPALPTAKFTNPSPTWIWTDLCDSPEAIYASGYTGARSEVYKFVLDTSNAVPVLSVGVVTVTMPPGEIVYALENHTNTFIGVGTSRGLRVGTYSGSDIALSLSVMSLGGAACNGITIRDHFFLCSYTNSDGTAALAAVDLTNQITDGVYALSSHLRANTETTVSTVGNLLSVDDSTQAGSLGTWTAVANATLARDTTFGPSLRMLPITTGIAEASTATRTSAYVVHGNQVYTASATWTCSGSAPFNLGLAWYDAAGNPIGVSSGIAQTRTLTVATGLISITATAPSGASFAAIIWITDATATTGEYYEIQNVGLYLGTQTTFFAPTGMPTTSSTGVPTYAMGNVSGVGLLGTRLVFVVDSVGLFIENPAVKVPTGVLTTSRIRFDTSEPKMFRQVRFRGENGGSITCLVGVDESVGTTNIGSIGAGVGNDSSDIPIIEPPGDYVALTFVFATDADGNAPIFHAYLLKALSAQARQHMIALPLLCFDRERVGKKDFGHEGFAQERLDALEALENGGAAVLLQYLGGSSSARRAEYVVIDSVEFDEVVPGTAKEPRGGSLNLSLRTV